LKLNVATKKKFSKKSTVENIYLSTSASTSDRRKVSKNNITAQNSNIAKSSNCKKSSALQNDKVTSVATRKSVGGTKQNNAMIDKMQSKVSVKVAGNPKKGKNFILENKLKVKKISSANKSQVGDNNLNDISQSVCSSNIQYGILKSFEYNIIFSRIFILVKKVFII